MRGKIVQDWSGVDMKDPKSRALVYGALNHYLQVPQTNLEVKAAMQHFATTGDFPTTVLQVLEKFGLESVYDEGWRDVFDVRDFTASNRNGFDILDVEHGLSFKKVKIGEKALIYKMGGAKVTVNFDIYGGGLGWHRTLFDDMEYWTLEDNARAFRNRAAYDRSQIYYDLIDAVGAGQNLAWQAVTPATVATSNENYNAIRDFNTINKACETILLAVKDKGYGVNTRSQFVLLAPIQLMGRINRAMGLLNAGISGSSFPGLFYNVRVVYTMMLSSSSVFYIALPKIKNKAGVRMNLTVFDEFDPMSYSDIAVGWERHGGAIGDSEQFQRCATA